MLVPKILLFRLVYILASNNSFIFVINVIRLNFFISVQAVDTDCEKNKEDIRPHLGLCDMLTPVDYVLGICDLTGELMRKCINSVGTGDIEEPFKLSLILQSIYEALMVCGNHSKELKRKLFTLKCSLQKVENACYAIKIRGTETPKHMLADFFSTEDDFKEPEACDI